MKETEIIELIIKRDESGLRLLEMYHTPLIRYIITPILNNTQDTDECVSEVIMKVWDNASQFDPSKGSWTAWLTAIARNTALNRLRQRKPTVSTEDISSEIPSGEPTPEEIVIKKEREKILRQSLSQLSQKDRAIFYRKYYYMQSTAQIASELSLSERAVEGKLYRIKKKLRKLLGGEFNE